MSFLKVAAWTALPFLAAAQSPLNGVTTYPNATDPLTDSGAQTNQTSPPKYPSPWAEGLGDWADAYQSARQFVSQLTLLEKVNLTTGVGWESEKCVGNVGSIPRLGFKNLCMQDSPLGVRDTDFNSAFPAGVTIAATWDRKLFYQRGYDMGSEHRDKGVDVQLGPVVGPIGRSPEGGRNWEGFSPDPALSAVAVAETVKGIQAAGVMACTKHYIGNEQEHYRQGAPPAYLTASISSNIDDITMHELYLWPFAEAVRAGTASIMCSYNQVNNSYSCQNSYMNNYLLKNELGFQGFVMSDWGAHHSGVSSALAGMDMSMPGDVAFDSYTSYWGPNLTIAVLNGTVPQWRLDDMAVRIVAGWYYVDREANQVPDAPNFSAWTTDTFGYAHYYASEDYTLINHHVDVRGEHAADIREQAAKGTVLLKNTGTLPLTGKEKLTAIFGSDSAENPYGPNGCADRGCDNGTLAMGWGSGTANFPYLVTPLEAIKAQVISQRGSIESVTDDFAYSQVSALAHRTDDVGGVCLVFVNADAGEGYITVDGNEGDRNNLTLWHEGDTLIKNVTGNCNNTVIVMHTVGPVLVDAWYDHPNVTAIIWAAIPGQESGNSITDVLYGKVNPGGRTPFTWGAARGDYGTDVLYEPNNGVLGPQDDFEEGVFIDYRAFDRLNETPIYEFGFGLSYTTFAYSNLLVTANSVPAYTPTTGQTVAASTFGTISNNSADYVYPANFSRVPAYIYPYINSTDFASSSGDPEYGVEYTFPSAGYDSGPQPYVPAGSKVAPGGNTALWDILFNVSATIANTGSIAGDEVPQLYLSLGGPNDPKVVLRNFDRLTIPAGSSATFSAGITRKDLSNWDPAAQDWYISSYPKTVYVGSSSRKLPLSSILNFSNTGTSTSNSSSSAAPVSKGTAPVSSSTKTAPASFSTGISASASSTQTQSKPAYTPPSGPPSYGPPGYGPPHYGPPQYGPSQYGPPSNGPANWGPPPSYGSHS